MNKISIFLTPTKKFLLLYLTFIVFFFMLIEYSYFESVLHINGVYSFWVTKVSALTMNLYTPVSYDNSFIYLKHATLEVKFGCNGLESLLLYVSAVLAYPATFKQKGIGVLVGFLVINIVNIFRIMVLGYVLIEYPDMFDVMHSYVTQNIMIVFVFLLFLIYLNLIESYANRS